MSTRYPTLAEVIQRKSVKRGRFVLSSGAVSDFYIDGKIASFDPEGSALIVEAILAEIDALKDVRVDAVGGMDMGATPIVAALANRSHYLGRPMPTFIVRKEVKGHGTMKRIEGSIPPPPCRVVIVDDVVTTGDSILKAIDAVREYGAQVVLAISILDRGAGATEAITGRGIPYRPLLTLPDVGITPPPPARAPARA